MLELNLPACPICQAQNSLSLKTMDRAGKPFTWYECQECGSVLLWQEDDRWTYQKVGREDQAHLLKKPMTAAELHDLVDIPDESPAAPELPDLVAMPDEPLAALDVQDQVVIPDESPAAPSPSVLAVPTEEPAVAPGTPEPVIERERKGPSRWLIIALALIGLFFVIAVIALLVANQLGF
jgi:hypothetical protein